MAVLDVANRRQVWAHFMRNAGQIAVDKPALLAAINAADDWADTNATAYNNALPLPARTSLTAAQKTLILMFVLMRRQGMLRVDGDP